MKTLFLFIFTLVLTLNLSARENPFEATQAYTEEAARILEQNETIVQEAKKKLTPILEIKENKKNEENKVIYVKPRTDIEENINLNMQKKILIDFIHINYNNDKLTIHTKDIILKKFTLEKENKLVIDYKAKKNFYTKREFLDSQNFKKITLGNHKKENFYRVVILLSKKPSNYKVQYKDKILTILSLNL